MHQKEPMLDGPFRCLFKRRGLFLGGSADGADGSAGAAVDAGTGVDLVMISTLRDSANGAAGLASAAANALIGNYVCHL